MRFISRLHIQSYLNRLKNQQGFSILEAMAAIGILSIIAFAFMGWASMYYRGISAVAENNEISNVTARLISAFGDDDRYCKAMLGTQPFSAGNKNGTSINALQFYNLDGTSTNRDIVRKDQKIHSRTNVIVQDIRLKPLVQLDTTGNVIISELQITFKKGAGSPTETEVTRSIPLHATVAAGRVIKCSISPANSVVVNQRLCEIKYSGSSFYPPTTEGPKPLDKPDHCKDTAAVKYCKAGAVAQLNCGCRSGYRVAASPLHIDAASYACSSTTDEGGKIPPRQYAGTVGWVTQSYEPSKSTLDIPSSTCKFAFAADADKSTYTTSIKCIPK